ncbi:patatin-like phospholipase domain-containing protein 4 isoform X2 [Pygocentrus nattereri]|uniref:patatin-like phospholipase domain-containing protein 4 isoform X2 n=1 Tax=Pygocentrus nattereri TaxID=42514 RepID=UPI0008142590|nr:patatin-like phospholipase domain-containing protein 4 isoform X2 [Pygocentrus nattereri]
MTVVNLSFAACGFMGIYQLGAVGAFLRHGNMLLASMRACAGASAGALVASVVITAPDKLEHCKEFTYRFASNIRRQTFGPLTPGYDFMMELRDGIEDILPSNAHLLANERLHISITNSRTGKNSMVSSFTSRDDLIKVLLASSFVPIYAGLKPVEFQGQFSKDNIKRLNQALFPPSLPRMQAIHQEGYEDALRFLRTEGWMQ